MICRSCGSKTLTPVLDLKASPTSNAFLPLEALGRSEVYYPLAVFVCNDCKLVQIADQQGGDHHFNEEYVYFSSTTPAFVEHARKYVEQVTADLDLTASSFVVEAASNDGYLLQFFKQADVPCLGVEPSASTANEALKERGVESLVRFFGRETAQHVVNERGHADLFIGNNVLAHVPDLNDFIGGIKILLGDRATATLEFPHLLNMVKDVQFDTVYHEHYSYISLYAVSKAMERHDLRIYRVEAVPVHGGSLRIYCTHEEADISAEASVSEMLDQELKFGLDQLDVYEGFQAKTDEICINLMHFLLEQRALGRKVVGYGAAAKGNTFLNYCGIKENLVEYVCDLTPAKQGKYLPGSRIPVVDEDTLKVTKPDYIFILAWNWRDQIIERLSFAREWDAKFVVAIPQLEVI